MGREVRLAPMENHTKGGMKKTVALRLYSCNRRANFFAWGRKKIKHPKSVPAMHVFPCGAIIWVPYSCIKTAEMMRAVL